MPRQARLPPEVRIHYRFAGPDEAAMEETERMRYADGAMVARRENVLRPFSYRVEGGDDQSMPWRDVQWSNRRRLNQVSVRVIPPRLYGLAAHASRAAHPGTGGQPRRKSPPGDQTAAVSHPVRRRRSEGSRRTQRRRLHVHRRDSSRKIRLLLVRADRSRGAPRRQRRPLGDQAVPDAPPTVSIERPTANLFVTPRSRRADPGGGHDDLAVRDMALVFHRAESGPERTRGSLWAGPRHSGCRRWPSPSPDAEGTKEGRSPHRRQPLGPRPVEVEAGNASDVLCHGHRLSATDRQERVAELAVITAEELQDRIASRQKVVMAELERALTIERGCRAQIESLLACLSRRGAARSG